MKVTAKIKLDLRSQNYGSSVYAVQGDGGSRCVEAALLDGGKPWNVPAGVTAAVAYKKPDFTKGLYDKLADGAPAVTVSGSTVTVVLAKQMLTVPGSVQACIVFNNAALDQLTTFPFTVAVAANPVIGADPSDDYIRLQWLEDKLDEYVKKITEGIVPGGSGGAVSSVNGKTGAVVLTADDVHALPDNTVIPTVPEKVSAFENDAGYLTEHQDISGKVDKVAGKGLSTHDYDDAAKAKVDAIPEDPKYTDTVYDDTEVKQGLNQLNKDLSALEGCFTTKSIGASINLFNAEKSTLGELTSSGTIIDSTWITSDFIPVDEGAVYRTTYDNGGAYRVVANVMYCAYDAKKKYISGSYVLSNQFTIAENVAFIRMTIRPQWNNLVMVGNDITIYTPYEEYRESGNEIDRLKTSKLPLNTVKTLSMLANENGEAEDGSVLTAVGGSVEWKKATPIVPAANDRIYKTCIERPIDFLGKKVTAFGDSITFGVYSYIENGVAKTSPAGTADENCYIYRLRDKLGFSLSNRAKSNSRMKFFDGTFTSISLSLISSILLGNLDDTDIVIVAGGTNDYNSGVRLGSLHDSIIYTSETDGPSTDTIGAVGQKAYYPTRLTGSKSWTCTDVSNGVYTWEQDAEFDTDMSFYASVEAICKYLQSYCAEKKVIFITPINVAKSFNDVVASLYDYRNAIYEVACSYGYDVICGEDVGIPNVDGAFKSVMIPDGLHPSKAGHDLYARTLCGILC